jgi:3-oxoadipate enol-lactonase
MPHVESNNVDIYYEWSHAPTADLDTAPIVVLSNSLSSNLAMWNPQVAPLTDLGYRVLRYDSRGHGQSSAPDIPYTIDMLAQDVVGLLDALGLESVHFCGLSMGGMVGQCLASVYPERLKSVTLCATAAYLNPPGVWDERRAIVETQGMQAVVEGTMERWFSPAAASAIPQELASVRKGILQTPPQGYANSCIAIRDMDQREAIKSIRIPTLVIAGEKDPSTTVAAAREITQAINGAELAIIPGAQHLLNIEMAEQFNSLLGGFLAEHQ